MSTHYVAMSGDHGYLPDNCEVHESLSGAVDSLAELFGLGRVRKRELRDTRSLELKPSRDGAEYCEIQECNCEDPAVHSDGGGY